MHGRCVLVLSLDYLFVTTKGVFMRKKLVGLEDEEFMANLENNNEALKVLVLYSVLLGLLSVMRFSARARINMLPSRLLTAMHGSGKRGLCLGATMSRPWWL